MMINLSTCSAEITDILLSSLSFKGISRPPYGTNYVIVCMWICGIMTFLIKYIMYVVYCNCIFGLEAIINDKRSESRVLLTHINTFVWDDKNAPIPTSE